MKQQSAPLVAKRHARPLIRDLGAACRAIRSTESEHRIELIDERGLAKDLAVLVGEYFVALLRDAHRALGDALGITKASTPVVTVLLTEPLRALADAIGDYALQLLAVARDDPEMRDEIVIALSPIVALAPVA